MPFPTEAKLIEGFIRALQWPLAEGVIERQLQAFQREHDSDLGELRVFRTFYGEFAVTSRNHIYRYKAPELVEKSEHIEARAARALALDFAHRVVSGLDLAYVEQPARGMPANRPSTFVFRWRQRAIAPHTSVYPNVVVVFVALDTAAVTQFLMTDLPFVRIRPPGIGLERAKELALSITTGGVVESAELFELPLDGGTRSTTVWTVQVLSKGGYHGIVYRDVVLDADTGAHIETKGY